MVDIGEAKSKVLKSVPHYKPMKDYLEALYTETVNTLVDNNDKFQNDLMRGEARAYKKLIELLTD